MARDSEVNADKLGNEASAVFVVRSGSISRQGGELELHEALEEGAHGLQGTQRIHYLEKLIQTDMFVVIILKFKILSFF